MSNPPLPARSVRRALLIPAALCALGLQAQTAPQQLEPFITAATRTPEAPQTLGSDVTALSSDDVATRQITTVSDALGSVSGAPLFASGAPGSTTSLFLRGANSDQTLFLVDGIRMSDPNTDYEVFLGGASLSPTDRIEIARGPQSTLYGGEAIGGVISISQAPGSGPAMSTIAVEGGSYDTFRGSVASQGAAGANAWTFSAQGGHTDNARANNRFDSANVALRVDHRVNDNVGVGGTVRWFFGRLGSPGDIYTNDPNDRETESNLLATTFVDAKLGADWTTHVTLGGQDRRYVADTPTPNPPYDSPSAKTVVTNRRGVLDAQATYSGVAHNRLTVGATGEVNQTRNTGFGAIDNHERLFAVFAEDEYSPVENVFLTGGLRNDDFDTFGRATTGRATVAWLPIPKTLKLRASYGTGFRSPSFLDLYGQDAYYVGNPNLHPERSRGADAGLDYYLPNNGGVLSATWFENDFDNLIDYDFSVFPSTVVNVGKARTRGAEFEARTTLPGAVEASVSYTYLDAQSLLADGHAPLLRRPRNQFNVDLHRTFASVVTIGGGIAYVGRRADVDAQSFATIVDGGYPLVRTYASWQVTPRLSLKGRVENLLDRKTQPVNGYPALGSAVFAGAEWTF
ncbi:MAG TPA: TonB-dependent receptor [Opitutaceae bacterium]|nr:TonB-dependent receptor [Opitutaceae bacterium]